MGRRTRRIKQNLELVYALFIMMKENKRWWLLPIIIVLALLSLFISLTGDGGHAALSSIYSLF